MLGVQMMMDETENVVKQTIPDVKEMNGGN